MEMLPAEIYYQIPEVPIHHVLTQVRARVGHDDLEWRLIVAAVVSNDYDYVAAVVNNDYGNNRIVTTVLAPLTMTMTTPTTTLTILLTNRPLKVD
jgi:hypothetical protein